MPDTEGLKPARLFLALWPQAPVRRRLAEEGRRLHTTLAGRPTRPETIHLTLVFIGGLARDRIPALQARLAGIEAAAFQIEFDRADCWRHNRVAFLAPSAMPVALLDLVGKLEGNLADLAIPFDRRPYQAHVTLLRKADCQKADPAMGRVSDTPEWGAFRPIAWSAADYVLVESVLTPDGIRYDLIGRYALL